MELFALVINHDGDGEVVILSIHATRADAVEEIYCFCLENWDWDDLPDPEEMSKEEAIDMWFEHQGAYSYYYKKCKVNNFPKPLKKDNPDTFLSPRQVNVIHHALSVAAFNEVGAAVGIPEDQVDVEITALLKEFPEVEE